MELTVWNRWKSGRSQRGVVLAGVLVCLFWPAFYFYYFYPHQGIGPEQPIYFSHRVHAGVKEINCRFCHPCVERSHNAGIPAGGEVFLLPRVHHPAASARS